MVGVGDNVPCKGTEFRKWTRNSVCSSLAISTKSMPLYDEAGLSNSALRSRESISVDNHFRRLLGLGFDQDIIHLNHNLRLVPAWAAGDTDSLHLDLPCKPAIKRFADNQF